LVAELILTDNGVLVTSEQKTTFCPHPLTPSPKLGEGELDNLLPSPKIGRGAGGEGETSKACQA